MKKTLCLVLSLLISSLCFTAFANEAPSLEEPTSISVVAQSEPQYLLVVDSIGFTLPHPLFIKNDRTMIEAQIFAQLIGLGEALVTEDSVTFKNEETTVSLSLTEPSAFLNEEEVTLDVYCTTKDTEIYVPLRFVAESFGCTVDYSPIFSDENQFLGAYISVETNKPSNVDFSIVLPDSLPELESNIIDITRTIMGITPNVTVIEADKYTDYVNSALLAGQKIMFVKNDETAIIDGHDKADLLASLSVLKPDAEEDDDIYSFGVVISDEALEFSVSKGVENIEEASYFLLGMDELIASLTVMPE